MADSNTEDPRLPTEKERAELAAWQTELERREHLVALSRKNAEQQGTKAAWRIVYNNEYEVRAWMTKRPARAFSSVKEADQ